MARFSLIEQVKLRIPSGLIRQRRDMIPQPHQHRAIANGGAIFGGQGKDEIGNIGRDQMNLCTYLEPCIAGRGSCVIRRRKYASILIANANAGDAMTSATVEIANSAANPLTGTAPPTITSAKHGR